MYQMEYNSHETCENCRKCESCEKLEKVIKDSERLGDILKQMSDSMKNHKEVSDGEQDN